LILGSTWSILFPL